MSFANYIKPLLNQKTDDQEWYLKAVTNSLNSYMSELETKLSVPTQQVEGTVIVPGSPPVTTPLNGIIAYFIPTKQRFTFEEVKSAMWCGNGEQAFINLYNLFGQKFAANFITLQTSPILQIIGTVSIPTTNFPTAAINLLNSARAIGSDMTPETFADLESKELENALISIPPIITPVTGTSLTPPGTFTGEIIVSFNHGII
jgi:hypothetical protein